MRDQPSELKFLLIISTNQVCYFMQLPKSDQGKKRNPSFVLVPLRAAAGDLVKARVACAPNIWWKLALWLRGSEEKQRKKPSPWVKVGDGLEGIGAPQQLVQQVDDITETRPLGAILQPALQHELVNGRGAVHRRRQSKGLVDGLHHLQEVPDGANVISLLRLRGPDTIGGGVKRWRWEGVLIGGGVNSPHGCSCPSTAFRRRP